MILSVINDNTMGTIAVYSRIFDRELLRVFLKTYILRVSIKSVNHTSNRENWKFMTPEFLNNSDHKSSWLNSIHRLRIIISCEIRNSMQIRDVIIAYLYTYTLRYLTLFQVELTDNLPKFFYFLSGPKHQLYEYDAKPHVLPN